MTPMQARALPWLLLLPALLFVTPLSPIADDPYPHLAGTGWAAFALLPLALLLLARGARARGAWPFALALGWALLSFLLAPVHDTFEARRACVGLALLPAAFAGGSALDAGGRRVFWSALVGLSALWTGFALLSGLGEGSLAGLLGDTGSLSQAALPGAAIGAAWFARESGARRVAGVVALGLFLLHVAAAPVLAGAHTLLAGLLLATWRGSVRGRGRLLALTLVTLLAPFVGMAARQAWSGVAPTMEGAPSSPSHSLTGLGVRGLVWTSAMGLVAESPLVGAGPGQFQAAFPPHRDPREIELSRHGVCSELDTEVEHAHNDWLQGFCDLGLVGGGLFALGLLLAWRSALRALSDDELMPAAMAALALLVNAFVHAPFSANPAVAPLAMGLFGSLVGASEGAAPRRSVAAILALPVLGAALFAGPLVRVGSALRAHVAVARELEPLLAPGGPTDDVRAPALVERLRASVTEALLAAPDAVPARLLAARELGGSAEAWDRVLALRPAAVEAWEQSGTEQARAGRVAEARERYARALALSPTHPRILRNLARLECTQGEFARGLEAIERLRSQGCLDSDWLAALGEELVLVEGYPERGARLLLGAPLEELMPEELHARSRRTEAEADPVSTREALECLAQLLWARQHATHGDFELARRNYRQALERSHARRGSATGPAPTYALELAAAELRAGHDEEARTLARESGPAASDPLVREALAPWAREVLGELGLEGPEHR